MKILALALDGNRGWPDLRIDRLDDGFNVFHGPATSAKTTLADLISHVLYGQRLVAAEEVDQIVSPEGELVVESRGRKYRLRRYHDHATSDRLTVAALDAEAVDRETVRQLTYGLSPSLTNQLYVHDFRDPARLEWIHADNFHREFEAAFGTGSLFQPKSSQNELVQRRDVLALALESRIAAQRKESRELDARWQELDRLAHECKQQLEQSRDRLRAVDTELAEIDSWLRCRRIEIDDQRKPIAKPSYATQRLADLDEQIGRWRTTLAELERREAEVRARIAQVQSSEYRSEVLVVDQRAHIATSRRLFADLQGEVARLARASQTDECACGSAHPRIRPIVATLLEQIDALETLADQQEQTARAARLKDEAELLARSQVDLRRQLDHLLDCRRALEVAAQRRTITETSLPIPGTIANEARHNGFASWETAPLESLTLRRTELWQKRGQLHRQLADLEPRLRKLREERGDVERRRTDVLSLRTIRELEQQRADVQHELERSTNANVGPSPVSPFAVSVGHASTILAQITDGELVQLRIGLNRFDIHVVNRSGDSRRIESLSPVERDQVRLSFSLAMVLVCGQHGIRLPLLLDEPFLRLNGRETTALSAVISDFAARGHQVLLFTAQQAAVDRCAALGATLHDMTELLQELPQLPIELLATAAVGATTTTRRFESTAGRRRRPVASGDHREREAG